MAAVISNTKNMTAVIAANNYGWLRNAQFDLMFIVGVLALAVVSGVTVATDSGLFPFVLFMDLWLLGYHHVISTFTRIAFDKKSIAENKFLVIWLPMLVAGAVGIAVFAIGSWTLVSVYLYWQWWHYTRQSYGISRIYKRKSGVTGTQGDRLTNTLIYAVPLWGILYRSYQSSPQFLYLELRTFPIPYWLVALAGVFAAIVFAAWAVQQARSYRAGEFAPAHTLYLLSHVTVFCIGYLLITDINYGWLVMNIWHNGQYILLVWMFNNNRFKEGVDKQHWLISTISQRRNVVYYFAVCLGISTIFYWLLTNAVQMVSSTIAISSAAVAILAVYQIINFHHYIVDSLIWKVRKKAVSQNFGVAK